MAIFLDFAVKVELSLEICTNWNEILNDLAAFRPAKHY